MMRLISLIFVTILLGSCKESEQGRIARLVSEWDGKTMCFPDEMCFISYGTDSVMMKCSRERASYTILNYVDSIGCLSCRLQLPRWAEMMREFDSISSHKVTCLFVFCPKEKEKLIKLLRKVNFNYFVYIDEIDTLNHINKFSDDENFQTFLLDNDDRVVAIGNPVHNPKIKDLYLKIISNDKHPKQKEKNTMLRLDNNSIDLGKFNYDQEAMTEFVLTNTGDAPLVVADVTTSCGCTSVEYSKEPILPGKTLKLIVKYSADQPGHFNKSINVFCNITESPLLLKITGEALVN